MKHLNFLSKSGGQSMGLRVTTLALTVGSPSAHRRGTMLRLLSVLVLIFTFGIGQMWGALTEEYSYTFTAQQFSNNSTAKTLGTITWTPSTSWKSGSGYWGYDGTKGQQWGSGKNGLNTLTLTAGSSISNIKKITINASIASDGSCKLSVKVGNTTIGTEKTLTTTATSYDFESATSLTGAVQIKLYNNSVNKAQYIKSITIYTEEAPAYTITASSNNNSWGTVSVSGTTITATPADCYQVASGTSGYNKISGTGTITHTGNSNTISVTPTSNCSIQVIFEKKIVNTFIDEIQDNGEFEDCSTSAPSLTDKSAATTGTCAQQHYHFVGWVTTANKANPTAQNIVAGGSSIAVNGTTYYAVWAKGSSGGGFDNTTGGTFKIYADVSGTKHYAVGTGSKISSTTNAAEATEYTFEKQSAGVYYIKTGSDYIKYASSTNLGTQTDGYSWTITAATHGSWRVTSGTNGRAWIYRAGSTNQFGGYSTSNVNGTEYFDLEIGGGYTYTDYKAVCCSPLGSINGSVSWTNGTQATLTWDKLSDVRSSDPYEVSVSPNAGVTVNAVDLTGAKATCSVTGLTAGTAYTFTINAYGNATHCDASQEISATAAKITAPASATALSGSDYAEGATTGGTPKSFTVSGVGLIGNLTVTAPSGFEVCSTQNGTYTGSIELSASGSGAYNKTITDATVWVRLKSGASQGSYGPSAITISGGGAANNTNVTIAGTVSASCHTPSISVQPAASASYNLNVTATALSITAAKGDNADPDLTYQWYSNTANSKTTPAPTPIEGATSSSYTPLTTAAGTKYYFCEVSSGACSETSNIAAFTVNTPTLTVSETSRAFGDRAVNPESPYYTMTFTVEGSNLAKDAPITISGAEGMFSVDKTSLSQTTGSISATTITVTYNPTAAGSHNETLTIASTGATSKTITLSGTGKYQVTYYANGDMEHPFATKLADGEGKLVLPDGNPTSCDATYTTFIGWYSTAAGNNGSPTTNISSCGTKAETTHSLSSNETYYAVFGNGALSADEVKQLTLDFSSNTNWQFPADQSSGETSSSEISYTSGDYTVKIAGDGTNKYYFNSNQLLIGKSSGVYLKLPAFNFEVSKIVATTPTATVSGKVTWNVFSGDNAVSTEVTGCTEGGTFVINESYRDIGTIYKVQVTNGNNLQIKALEIYSPGVGATAFISTCCTKHSITLDDEIANGSVASTESSVCEGTSVTLTATATPNAGRFNSWNITGLDSYSATTNPLTFDMPDNDITVSATFDALYAITKVEEGGTITLGANYAAENDVVTISAVAKQDYEEPRVLKVYKTNDESTEITITNGQFTMPGYPVTAKVTYTPSKTPLPAPTMGANSDLTYNSVQLNWTNVANNSGYVLTVMQGEDVVEGYDAKAIDKDATSAVISGLEHLTDYTYTLYAKGDGITYVAVNTAANGGFTTLDYPTVKIYYSENEVLRVAEGTDQQILTDFTLPSTALNGCTQKELVGWTTAANAEYSHDTDAPTGMLLPGAKWQIPTNANCTLYAVYAKVTPEVVSWDATAITNIETSDIFVIVGNNGSNYALPNDGGASSPTVAAVTIANNKLSAAPAANLQWNLSSNASGYTFYPNGSSTTWLYLLADNNKGVRIGNSESNKVFTINGGYLYCATTTTPRYVGIYNSEDWRCYTSTSTNINDQTFTFYKKNVTPASMTKYATQCMAQVAKPVINGVTDGETYEEAKTITITSATNGATIYYTTDGTEPTTSSNAYSTPFEVSANGDYTIRAIAVKDEMVNSDEATAVSFSLDLPFTTIASFIAATPTNKKLVFTAESNARVLAYNKNRIYIQDGTGAMYLYNTGSNNDGHGKTWASGKKIVGTLTGTYTTNDNMPRMTVTDFGATDVTDDAIELPTPIAVEELATNFANNVCKLVTINGVSIRSESVANNNTINMTKNNVTYNIYNAFNALTGHTLPLNSTSCTVTGILGQSNSGNTLQLMPISADGISTNGAEALLPVLSVTGSTNSAEPFEVATNKEITFTPNSNFSAVYAVNDGEETAVGNSTNVTITDEANATKVYIKATREYYTDKEVTYYYLANPALIEYDITKSSMSHGSATIQNAQGDAITYAVGGATVTLVANPAEHYHWVSWEVTAGGEPVTVTNNTFEMPNAAVTVSATFEEDDYATVAFAKGNAGVTGDAPASQKVYVGENATMPGKGSMILSSHNFAGWKLGSNAVLNTGDTYTVTAADHEAGTITFEAQWEPYPWASAGKWELVTSASEITVNPTTYVIFADTLSSGNTACGLTQNDNNRATVSVTKTDNLLTWTGADPAIFIVEEGKDEGTFAFYDAINNNYIHAASGSKNYLHSNTDKNTDGAAWTIDAIRSNGGATVTADTYTHNLLNLNGNICAAYTAPQKGLAIYKFVGGSYYNIVYAKGTEDVVRNMPEGHVTDENGEAAVKENTPIRVGYTFTGWKDQDDNVYTYNDGHVYTFTKNVTLTAQWEEQTDKYTVSYDANGSSDAVPAEAAYFENAEVTVAGAVSKVGFVFMGWECNGRVYTAGSKFYMPATDMPMVAKYAHGATYDNMTKVSNVCSIESHDAPEGSEAVFTNNYTTAKQITKNNSMTLTLSGYTGYTIEGVKLSTGSNNTSGQGTLSITIGGVEVATDANADKWYNGVHHYGSNNGTDFENVLVSMNPKTVKYGEDIVITIAASESSLYCQSFTILYDLLPVEVENTTTIEARDLAAGTEVIIHDGGTLNVDADKQIGDLTVEAGGKVVLDANKLTVVGTFTLETTMASGASGQLTGATASNFATNGPAYIDITLGAGGRADHWHAITVPFPVDAINGIYDLDGNKLNNEEHYAIMEYLGNVRAQGKYGWKKYRKTLVPGTFYLMTVDGGRTTYRFMKTADGALVAGNSKEIFEYAKSGEGQTTDAGWNGVGNPTLVYGKVNAEVQVLDPVSYTYIKKDANSTNFVVGTPFFYQADGAGSISMLTADAGANYAPARVATNGIEKIKVSFGNEAFTDYLDISASEEALNEYQIGKDLVKMTMTNTPSVAQIFGNAYNAKLCMVYAPMVNDKATFDLTLYAPAAGTYTIAAPSMENATLYLTKNGRIYWNLTMGACELDLNQGQNNEYGLVLRAEAPAVTTGIENGELLNGENGVQKVVIDEHVYILRGGEMYDMTGKMVK